MVGRLPCRAPAPQPAPPSSYRVELPLDALDEQGQLLDWVIGFAFDTLDARRLDVRIVPAPGAPLSTEEHDQCQH